MNEPTIEERFENLRLGALEILQAARLLTRALDAEIGARKALEKRVAFLETMLEGQVGLEPPGVTS